MLSKKKFINTLILFILVFCNCPLIYAQVDSSYIQAFDQDFSTRIYAHDKFAGFDKVIGEDETIYKTNNPVNIGLGITWKHYTFSFSYGFDYLRDKKKGKTHSLEFQHHSYGQRIMYDIFLQQHEGLYHDIENTDNKYTLHPDIQFDMYGGSLQYILNHKKFSARAAFNLNEKQVKSAGSFLIGGSVYYSKVQTDSTLLFDKMDKKHKNLQLGASLGYAYNWAISRRWTATIYASGGITMGNNHPSRFFEEKMMIYPAFNARFALGYNAKTWSVGTTFMLNKVFLFYDDNQSLSMDNQQIQLTIVKRFHWRNKFVNNTLDKTKRKLRL